MILTYRFVNRISPAMSRIIDTFYLITWNCEYFPYDSDQYRKYHNEDPIVEVITWVINYRTLMMIEIL